MDPPKVHLGAVPCAASFFAPLLGSGEGRRTRIEHCHGVFGPEDDPPVPGNQMTGPGPSGREACQELLKEVQLYSTRKDLQELKNILREKGIEPHQYGRIAQVLKKFLCSLLDHKPGQANRSNTMEGCEPPRWNRMR